MSPSVPDQGTTQSATRTVPRLAWPELAVGLRRSIERSLGSEVVSWHSQEEGFSPAMAARCGLADDRSVFIKALPPEMIELTGDFFRHEILVNRALPDGAPAPTMLEVIDTDDGLAVVFETIDGHTPTNPWDLDELQAVIGALDDLDLPPVEGFPEFRNYLADDFKGWRRLAAGDAELGGVAPDSIEPWLDDATLNRLADLESGWADHAPPTALIHSDVRADNLLIGVRPAADAAMERGSTDAASVWLVDWAHASNGPSWFDLVGLIPSVVMQGGPAPEQIWAMSRHATTAPIESIDAAVIAIAGYFTASARKPPVPQIPMLRTFQEAQGAAARAWMRQRLGL